MIACPLESILILQYQLSCRRHVGIIVSFFRSRLATLWSLYPEKTVLGDGCVGSVIEAMNTGARINFSNLSDSSNKIDDEVIEGWLSSKNSQY